MAKTKENTKVDANEDLKLSASQMTLLKNMKSDGYTLKNSAFLGESYFALHKGKDLSPIPVNRKTAVSMVGKGLIEPADREKNVTSYVITAKGKKINLK